MNCSLVHCQACGFSWTRPLMRSIYERQAMESRPCPVCGSQTLTCRNVSSTKKKPPPKNPRDDSAERVG